MNCAPKSLLVGSSFELLNLASCFKQIVKSWYVLSENDSRVAISELWSQVENVCARVSLGGEALSP